MKIIIPATLLVAAVLITGLTEFNESKYIHSAEDHSHITSVTEDRLTEIDIFYNSLKDTSDTESFPFKRSETEWKQILTDKEFRILREKGTELPYVNEYNDNKKEGIYVCAACGQKLYSSEHKYNSGTGWPSFWQPLNDSLVAELEDNSWFMTRTEIVCSNCGSHIGHVFDDGPQPTGLRYCMNSVAMDFIPKSEIKPEE